MINDTLIINKLSGSISSQLSIKDCACTDNENGILTSGDKDAELLIENSEFGNSGFGEGYSHNLYVEAIKNLSAPGRSGAPAANELSAESIPQTDAGGVK